jgi:anthranilate phosphoribosyltransferase
MTEQPSAGETRLLLQRLLDGGDLAGADLESFIGDVMDGRLGEAEMAAVLVGLRAKGETGEEVAAAARAMRARAIPVPVAAPGRAVDTCGTGGDGADTVNISTAAALVAAAAGVPVAKHGNRSVSSRCGSADVLEALGVRLEAPPELLGRLHDELGIAFLFAPRLHPAMGVVMPVRRALGVRTIFNLLGPLTNPAGVLRQVVGVWGRDVQPVVASALAELGAGHALVVHSDDGLDELSVLAPTTMIEVREGAVVAEHRIEPADLGIDGAEADSLRGGEVADNARRLEAILGSGERSAAAEAVALNAAAALLVAGEVSDLRQGLERSREVLRSGAALAKLRRLASRSAELAVDA